MTWGGRVTLEAAGRAGLEYDGVERRRERGAVGRVRVRGV